MSSETGLTAELRVQVVFIMIHVMGSQAAFLDTHTHSRVRENRLLAGSTLIILLTTVRKKQPYTDQELDEIFGPVCKQFFDTLDVMKL